MLSSLKVAAIAISGGTSSLLCSLFVWGDVLYALEVSWAHGKLDALWCSSEATVLVCSNTDGVLLGIALWLLCGSFSLSEVYSLEDRDGSLDGEGSVLGLNSECSMSCLSAFAAVCLTDLVELGVWSSSEHCWLSCLSPLLVTLAGTSSETRQLSEIAWAFKRWEAHWADFLNIAAIIATTDSWPFSLSFSKVVLCAHLSKSCLGWCCRNGTSEECD